MIWLFWAMLLLSILMMCGYLIYVIVDSSHRRIDEYWEGEEEQLP